MISYSAIGSKVWKSVASTSPGNSPSDLKISKEEISFLDFQVLNWHRSIPSPLKYTHPDSAPASHPPPAPPRTLHRLQILLYLRANQMRILIYRPVLHTATTILSHLDSAHTVVKVAKDTIRILTHLNHTSDIYRTQQTIFNYFLISALAVLFLAVAHAPADFSATCRDEFYMALDLVRGLSSDSHVSKRLWRTVRMLKEVGPRLGLASHEPRAAAAANDDDDDHDHHDDEAHALSDAAVAMAGLAGHAMHDMSAFGSAGASRVAHAPPPPPPPPPLDTPHGMALDLTTLFEAAGGAFGLSAFDGIAGPVQNAHAAFAGQLPAYGQENDELARIMEDLF